MRLSLQKAIDHAIWKNHHHRFDNNYGVVLSSKGDYMVHQTDHPSFDKSEFEVLPKDYTNMDNKHIRNIRMDDYPLRHWEDISGMFSVTHGELLHFILSAKVPLKRFIRYELACRGYDKEFAWVGFEDAEKIWLK